ncbi:DUF5682 family protein [Streptacidiphilus sp. P02-A3a]|uniref:DUF5682 family protein n=1 Tax=Streptacidiphilus sp. P02-A3a TaxID=2704468 RepID=UPI0015FB3A1D|nr:DUF5682 family protein [Streptacidiphilus sp. P02-A3a]QMU72663.1 hypothetical protein GXP74_34875 [Streptacidiphilus sp. P02-A3a]
MTHRQAEGVALLGVRHHGPGSARAVAAALRQYQPDAVLIEGPAEADALLAFAADKEMVPPVALLAHIVDEPARAAFWPYAAFSPEWVALRHALDRDLPVHFIDLPAAHSLAAGPDRPEDEEASSPGAPRDPIGELARVAGHDDPEQWWEDVVEHRLPEPGADALDPFRAIAEAMAELRTGPAEGTDIVREAHMRRQLRAARRAGHQRIAVVCGAWHVPALAARVSATEDNALLKGLPKAKVELTWVPWTHRRLSQHTGYGAGIASPGWYQHLFESPDPGPVRWLTRMAALLRAEDYSVSSAHVIEAARLAETLAVMRGRPVPGLAETLDAARAVLCEGSDVPLALISDRLVVGEALGAVPEGAPAVPLQRDLSRSQRALRLKPEPDERLLDLDLRKETDAARSRLLHRLRLLDIHWGRPADPRTASTGTFRESWRLRWEPELAVSIAEAGIWGTTVESAAQARAADRAVNAAGLAEVTGLAESCLLADLPGALDTVLSALADRAALDADVAHLAEALPALVRSLRYGDVRGTDASALRHLAESLAVRICVGLPPACAHLDAEGATAMAVHLGTTHAAVALLADGPSGGSATDGPGARWPTTLRTLARRDTVPGLLRGRATRLLLDDNQWDADEAARHLGLALSAASEPADAAGWIEGFLAGGGMLLIHDTRLLGLVDDWLTGVPEAVFPDVLPLLRRTFSGFEAAVRRTVGERVRAAPGATGGQPPAGDRPGFAAEPDQARAGAARATAALLLAPTADPTPDPTADPTPAPNPDLTEAQP